MVSYIISLIDWVSAGRGGPFAEQVAAEARLHSRRVTPSGTA